MATPTTLPISVDDLSTEIGIPTTEAGAALPIAEQMQRAIDYAQAQIASYTKQNWTTTTETRTWTTARPTNKLIIGRAATITKVQAEQLVTTEPATTLAATEYKLVRSRQLYRIGGQWQPDQLYHVTATYGWATPPPDIIHAHIRAAAYILTRMTAPEGVMGAGSLASELPNSYEFPGEIINILRRHTDPVATIQ